MTLSNAAVKAAVPNAIQWLKDNQPTVNTQEDDPRDCLHAIIHQLTTTHLEFTYIQRYGIPLETAYNAYDGAVIQACQLLVEINKRIQADHDKLIEDTQ